MELVDCTKMKENVRLKFCTIRMYILCILSASWFATPTPSQPEVFVEAASNSWDLRCWGGIQCAQTKQIFDNQRQVLLVTMFAGLWSCNTHKERDSTLTRRWKQLLVFINLHVSVIFHFHGIFKAGSILVVFLSLPPTFEKLKTFRATNHLAILFMQFKSNTPQAKANKKRCGCSECITRPRQKQKKRRGDQWIECIFSFQFPTSKVA